MANCTKSRRDIFPFAANLVIDLISMELFSLEIAVSELARRPAGGLRRRTAPFRP
jgi:hypothetical protein